MPTSTTVPATPAAAGIGGGTATGTGGTPGGPDNKLLSFIAFNFVRHARIGDLHQALNNNYSDTICDAADIDTIFTANRADIKSDTDSMRATRRLLVERVVAPVASETSGNKANVVVPAIDRASFEVSDLATDRVRGDHSVRVGSCVVEESCQIIGCDCHSHAQRIVGRIGTKCHLL